MGTSLKPILKRMGYVSTRFITDLLFPNKKYHQKNILTENFLWKILYNPKNVSREAKAAIYDRTIDGVSAKSLIDFGEGIKRGCLFNSSGESYQVGLNNIHKPFLQMTYELDVLANPFETLRDHFNYIGTDKEHRYFYSFEDQGHEDFLMAEKFHQNLIHVVDFIQKYR
jgi:hypothetical protein